MIGQSGLLAQTDGIFTIHGTIRDQQGEPIPYCSVQIDSLRVGIAANADGVYELKNVQPGKHTITVKSLGYASLTKTVACRHHARVIQHFTLHEDAKLLEEVVVAGESEKEQLENSSKAVEVIDTKEAKLKSADLGEVMAQTQGVSVRRSGGLGSSTRFSLNGLSDDQIRFFINGIPLEYSGYSFGIANVPVNLVDRIEIYKGVVPAQFGADALGGAVNIVSPKMHSGWSGSASYQIGSFGTHRTSLDVKYLNDTSGFFAGGGGFYDVATNNYKVNVQVPNEKGKLSEAEVPRFHDRYRGRGMNLQVGLKNKKWANELSVQGFYTDFEKEIQHNQMMEGVPYGEVMSYRNALGGNLKYIKKWRTRLSLDVTGGYSHSQRQFVDTSHGLYDWNGVRLLTKRNAGEITSGIGATGASNQFTWDNVTYGRIQGGWKLSEKHMLRLSLAPTYSFRTGDERMPIKYDPITARGKLLTWVNGLEYQLDGWHHKLENVIFVKDYLQRLESIEEAPNGSSFVTERQSHTFGAGDGLRYRWSGRFLTKLSYEYATRLPRPDELFGNGQFIGNNTELKPEQSHNTNVEVTYANRPGAHAQWRLQANGFLRKVNNLIQLTFDTEGSSTYKNIHGANSVGGEVAGHWSFPNDKFSLDLNSTYQHFYNSSRDGEYGKFYGDRVPNTPYLFANGSASYSLQNLLDKDKLTLFYSSRYIHSFYRSWESAGLRSTKQEIPSQQVHHAGVTYRHLFKTRITWSLTAEVQNIGNARVYDFYGVQKPGRAFYLKLTTQF